MCLVLAGLAVPCGGQSRGRPDWGGDVNPVRDAVHLYLDVLWIPVSAEQVARMNAALDPIDPAALAVEGIREGRSKVLYALNVPVLVGEAVEWQVGSEQLVVSAKPATGQSPAPDVALRDTGITLRFRSRWVDPERRDELRAEWSIRLRQYLGRVPVSGDEESSSSFGTASHQFDQRVTLGSTVYAATLVTEPAPAGQVVVAYRIRMHRESAGEAASVEGEVKDGAGGPAAVSVPDGSPAAVEVSDGPRGRRPRR